MISIVTVVKNDLNGIKKTYQSLKSQSYQSYEWIIIDAISNDGTVEFINSINNINLKFISEKDKGIYDGMNKGIKYATMDYIYF